MKTAIIANDATESDALFCALAVTAPTLPTDWIMYMPAGRHAISATRRGKQWRGEVAVTPESAAALEAQRAALTAKGRKPYFDFNHDDGEASFWPDQFAWKDGPDAGVYAHGEYTDNGNAAIKGKRFRQFSPVFHIDDKATPARIICNDQADPNMGGFVNDPAFKQISPLWAKRAGELEARHGTGLRPETENQNTMTTEEIAALRAKITQLEQQLAAIQAKDAKDANDKATIKAIELEIRASKAEERVAALTAKNDGNEAALKEIRAKNAKEAVDAAVKKGAIAAKDQKAQDALIAKATEDPSMIEIILNLPGNAALSNGSVTRETTAGAVQARHASVTREDPRAVLKRMLDITVKRNRIGAGLDAVKAREKGVAALEFGAIYAAEFSERDGQRKPILDFPISELFRGDGAISAADYADPAGDLGTLSGTLVAQRTLELFKLVFPMISKITTDFSDMPAQFNQAVTTRVIGIPATQLYDATLDSSGRPKGWDTVSAATTFDRSVTLNKHVGVPIVFDSNTLASTARRLFDEIAPAAAYALAKYAVDLLYNLLTPANFAFYALNSLAGCTTVSGSTTLTVGSTTGVQVNSVLSGTGIPAGTLVVSITDGTHLVMSQAATASNGALAIGVNATQVPNVYTTFPVAQADFRRSSLSLLSAIFNQNRVPLQDRFALLNSLYYQQLANDPTLVTFRTAPVAESYITENELPKMSTFSPIEAPNLADNNATANLTGFAGQRAALCLASRVPGDYTTILPGASYGNVSTITNPDLGLSMLLVQYVNHTQGYAEWRLADMMGVAIGDPRAGLVITSQ